MGKWASGQIGIPGLFPVSIFPAGPVQ